MEVQWQKELCAAAVLTFEEMCMLMPDEITEGKVVAKALKASCVKFSGPMNGEICVVVDEAFLPELVMHIVGETEAGDMELLQDGLGEVANIIAGNVLPKIGGDEAVFVLESPVEVEHTIALDHTTLLVFEGGGVSVGVRIAS